MFKSTVFMFMFFCSFLFGAAETPCKVAVIDDFEVGHGQTVVSVIRSLNSSEFLSIYPLQRDLSIPLETAATVDAQFYNQCSTMNDFEIFELSCLLELRPNAVVVLALGNSPVICDNFRFSAAHRESFSKIMDRVVFVAASYAPFKRASYSAYPECFLGLDEIAERTIILPGLDEITGETGTSIAAPKLTAVLADIVIKHGLTPKNALALILKKAKKPEGYSLKQHGCGFLNDFTIGAADLLGGQEKLPNVEFSLEKCRQSLTELYKRAIAQGHLYSEYRFLTSKSPYLNFEQDQTELLESYKNLYQRFATRNEPDSFMAMFKCIRVLMKKIFKLEHNLKVPLTRTEAQMKTLCNKYLEMQRTFEEKMFNLPFTIKNIPEIKSIMQQSAIRDDYQARQKKYQAALIKHQETGKIDCLWEAVKGGNVIARCLYGMAVIQIDDSRDLGEALVLDAAEKGCVRAQLFLEFWYKAIGLLEKGDLWGKIACLQKHSQEIQKREANTPLPKNKMQQDLIDEANAGKRFEQSRVGYCFLTGTNGFEKDYAEAVVYLSLAADQLCPVALYNLGLCYENGWGLAEDTAYACALYKQAADLGNVKAMYALAVNYRDGIGIERDRTTYYTSIEYFKKARDLGHQGAKDYLDKLDQEKNEYEAKSSISQWAIAFGVVLTRMIIPAPPRRTR